MLLKAGDQEYTAHFSHVRDYLIDGTKPERFGRQSVVEHWTTYCAIHKGRCKVKGCADLEHPWVDAAVCHENDQFSRRIGRKIALGRALKGLPRDLRKQLWESYFAISPIRGGV